MNHPTNKPTRFHIDKEEDIAGFALTNVPKDHYFWLLQKQSLTSDEPDFYSRIEQLANPFLGKVAVSPDRVSQFLVLIHRDLSADLFLNDFQVLIEMMAKRDVKKMEVVRKRDIADIRRLRFPAIKIDKTDKVVYCFKVGWKFALFFDLTREFDLKEAELALGTLYRRLSFEYVFKTLESGRQFGEMLKDGWFPFLELIGGDYEEIGKAYENKFGFEGRIERILSGFDSGRISRITGRWWSKDIFQKRKEILEAGISSFVRGGNEGYINCINTLLPQVEGIIRIQYLSETGKGEKVNLPELLKYVIEKGKTKGVSDSSLLLPEPFLKYLKDVVYCPFNLETGKVDLSRHSSSHGVAKPEAYTKSKALQAILLLDQIYFYI